MHLTTETDMNDDFTYLIYQLENKFRATKYENGPYTKISRSDGRRDIWTDNHGLTVKEALRRLRCGRHRVRVVEHLLIDLR